MFALLSGISPSFFFFCMKAYNPSQDLIGNSPYCLPYNSYDIRSENLVLDQLIIT